MARATNQTIEPHATGSAPDPQSGAHWLWGPIRASRGAYSQVILAASIVNILSLATSLFIMTVYDRVIPNNAVESLIALTVGMALALAFDFILKTLRGYFIDLAGQRLDLRVGSALFSRLVALKQSVHAGAAGGSAGGTASLVREFETLKDFFTSATLIAVVDLPFVFLFIAVIALIGGPVAWVPFAAIPVVFVAGFLIQPAMARLSNQGMAQGQSKHAVLVETLAGLETVKAVGAAPMMQRRWVEAQANHAANATRGRFVSQLAINIAGSMQQISQVGVVVVGVFLIAGGSMSVGALIACVILSGRALSPLGQLANVLSRVNGALSSYRALDQLMGADTEADRGLTYLRRTALSGKIEFRNVSFRYPGETDRVLSDVSFSIEPGERVGLLGRIGSGKSTINRLILGLHQPLDGAVLIDDSDVRQIHPDDLRNQIGAVLQDVFLISGSIRENIALGLESISDDDLLAAAKSAGVHDFVGQMANGYDMRLADRGQGLSGGQRQAIAIARALVRKPPILLFDEPTSAMDVNSENALIARLEPEVKGRTLILCTHRSSMLRLVDRVIIIDKGRVVAEGPRDDVLKSMAVGGSA
ncbi:MAG: type I secretion system permease/ATPase [Pseudomonadota bacterium]